ncbi:hypothetical protein [Streptomyces sp. NPDC058661]|uniref:hypothetical protein n=1 Tax=Streptomyces sp. NPDC058661 TaxID=3346582 RepID=UPI003648B26E
MTTTTRRFTGTAVTGLPVIVSPRTVAPKGARDPTRMFLGRLATGAVRLVRRAVHRGWEQAVLP